MSVIHKKDVAQKEIKPAATEELAAAVADLKKQNADLTEQTTALQLALCELYEKGAKTDG